MIRIVIWYIKTTILEKKGEGKRECECVSMCIRQVE